LAKNFGEIKMKKKIFLGALSIIVLVVIVKLIYAAFAEDNQQEYRFGEVTRGNLESTISSSGTLSPVTTVEVGTQVSGTIDKIYADYNDHVKKGQLLAVLDTVLLKVQVLDAEANLEKTEAQLEEAQNDYNRNKQLFDKGIISEAEFIPYSTALKTQKANMKSSKASLERARRNLKYAVIRAPISGTVILRNVEAGQTVAASFSTPTLFKIAEDLSQMEILADVDESDIGQIKDGQSVRFTVQAYPDKIFTGTVKQIRLEPTTESNVVIYTVVIRATNPEKILLPGMTATIDFITSEEHNVLLVPNAALRFQPDEKTLAEFRKQREKQFESLPDSVKEKRQALMANRGFGSGQQSATSGMSGFQRPRDLGQVWYLDQNGKLAMDMVRTGMTDGTETQIVRSRHLKEGMKVATGMATANETRSTQQTQERRFHRPMFYNGACPMHFMII
jgi:HlyD family secretion protein